jgi:actin-related protein 5
LIIRRTEKSIQKAKDRQLGIEEVEEKVVHTFDLIDVPDDELSEDSKREKKKQKLIKAGQEAREKAKKLREEEELKKAFYSSIKIYLSNLNLATNGRRR